VSTRRRYDLLHSQGGNCYEIEGYTQEMSAGGVGYRDGGSDAADGR
jgi:hypothetical protein